MNVYLVAATGVAALAALFDVRSGRIPNWLTYGACVAGLVAHAATGYASGHGPGMLAELLTSLGGALVCAAVPGIIYLSRGMGAGDVKLFVAVGTLAGLFDGLSAQTYSIAVALVVVPAYLAWRGSLMRTLKNSLLLVVRPFRRRERREPVPLELYESFRFAPAILAGCILTFVLQG